MSFRTHVRNLRRFLQGFALFGMTILFMMSASHAEEKKLDDVLKETTQEEKVEPKNSESVYSPDHCDFEVTFPEKPFEAKRCPEESSKCYSITNYTMVYDLKTTVDVSATCVPAPERSYER